MVDRDPGDEPILVQGDCGIGTRTIATGGVSDGDRGRDDQLIPGNGGHSGRINDENGLLVPGALGSDGDACDHATVIDGGNRYRPKAGSGRIDDDNAWGGSIILPAVTDGCRADAT